MAQKSIEWRFLDKQKIRLYQNRTVIRSVLNKKNPRFKPGISNGAFSSAYLAAAYLLLTSSQFTTFQNEAM